MSVHRSTIVATLVERGFIKDATDLAGLDEACAAGPVTAYIGFDLTAPSLHVGSMIQLMVLRHLKTHGHEPIALLGGATTLVGDPSDKMGQRPMLDAEAIEENRIGIQGVLDRVLGPTRAVSNLEWFRDITFLGFLRDFGPHFTVNRMISSDVVARRLAANAPMTFMEFTYSLMQSVDFLEMNRRTGTALQIGGSDQWTNILGGVDLIRRLEGKTAFGLTTPLMTDEQGRKMGKTAEGRAVWLDPSRVSSFDLWQFWRNVPDAKVGEFLGLFTDIPMDEVRRLGALEGAAINDAKKTLATEAVAIAHGRAAAEAAAAAALEVFSTADGTADGMPTSDCPADPRSSLVPISEFAVHAGLCESKSAARRLASQGGLRINGERRRDADADVSPEDFAGGAMTMAAGRRRRVRFELNGPSPILPLRTRIVDRADGLFEVLAWFPSKDAGDWDCVAGPFGDRSEAERRAGRVRTAASA